jgi:acetylcholinesterase
MKLFTLNGFIILVILSILTRSTIMISVSKCLKNEGQKIILETTHGRLLGSCQFVNINTPNNSSQEHRSGNVYYWLSVPYAEPPIGRNRFRPPIEIKPWSGILNATKLPNVCMQDETDTIEEKFAGISMWSIFPTNSTISEDCLYLSIWLPLEAYQRLNLQSGLPLQSPKIPIIVFFHGGKSIQGSSILDIYNPSAFVAATNTIFISVNYRLGPFGFIYLEGEFGGNQAILDQNLAIRWIKKNAERLGGDPSRITLMGFSAGASLAGYHLFYKESWNLFNNIILQSGTPLKNSLMPITKQEANKRSRQMLINIGCGKESSNNSELAKCAIDQNELVKAAKDYLKSLANNKIAELYLYTAFPPIIDGIVLTDTIENSLKRGNFKQCPILLGFTADEGTMKIAISGLIGKETYELRKQPNISHSMLKNFIIDYYKFYPNLHQPTFNNKHFINAIMYEYTKILHIDNEETNEIAKLESRNKSELLSPFYKQNYFNILGRILGEQAYVCPAYRLADYYAKYNNNVYMYLYAHRISSTPWPSWYGALHGDDLAMIFALPLLMNRQYAFTSINPWTNPKHIYLNSERLLSLDIITYLSNFAKYSTPNKPFDDSSIRIWPKYTIYKPSIRNSTIESTFGQYIILKINGTRVNRGFSVEQCQFWNNLIPSFINEDGEKIKIAIIFIVLK